MLLAEPSGGRGKGRPWCERSSRNRKRCPRNEKTLPLNLFLSLISSVASGKWYPLSGLQCPLLLNKSTKQKTGLRACNHSSLCSAFFFFSFFLGGGAVLGQANPDFLPAMLVLLVCSYQTILKFLANNVESSRSTFSFFFVFNLKYYLTVLSHLWGHQYHRTVERGSEDCHGECHFSSQV